MLCTLSSFCSAEFPCREDVRGRRGRSRSGRRRPEEEKEEEENEKEPPGSKCLGPCCKEGQMEKCT